MRNYKNLYSDEKGNSENENYVTAYKRMKRIKSFYSHLLVYIFVNIAIIVANFYENPADRFFSFETFSVAFFWGIGLAAHAFSVFGKNILFSQNWEERKIQKLIEEENQNKKWE